MCIHEKTMARINNTAVQLMMMPVADWLTAASWFGHFQPFGCVCVSKNSAESNLMEF